MKIVSRSSLAIALALGLGATSMVAAPANAAKKEEAPKGKEPQLSKEARPLLAAAQAAITAGDTATAQAKLTEADGVASTVDDKFYIAQLRYNIAQKANDQAGIAAAIDAMIASNSPLAQSQIAQMYQAQGQFAFQAKNYQKAEAAYQQLVQLSPTPDNLITLAEIKNTNSKTAEALDLVDRAIAAKKQAGGAVDEAWYKRALAIAYTAKDVPATLKWGQAWVAAYPTPSNWRNALYSYREIAKLDNEADLDLMRLTRAAKALNGERDFYEYADYAFQRGLPGEAKAVVDEGYAAKMLDASNKAATEVRTLAAPKIAADKASLPASEKAARASATGKSAAATADAYLGYADYAKAAELYQLALQKGGIDPNVLNTRLGIALALSGQKDAAKQAFALVTGARVPLAQYWTTWVNTQA
jgi:hypothetical protein